MNLIPGQGHFGPDAIPGVRHAARARRTRTHAARAPHCFLGSLQDARWRRGESVSLKAARDSMVSLELAQYAQMTYAAK